MLRRVVITISTLRLIVVFVVANVLSPANSSAAVALLYPRLVATTSLIMNRKRIAHDVTFEGLWWCREIVGGTQGGLQRA